MKEREDRLVCTTCTGASSGIPEKRRKMTETQSRTAGMRESRPLCGRPQLLSVGKTQGANCGVGKKEESRDAVAKKKEDYKRITP